MTGLLNYILGHKEDAIQYKALQLMLGAENNYDRDKAVADICTTISLLPSEVLQDTYSKDLAKLLKLTPGVLKKIVKSEVDKKEKEESIQFVNEGQKALPKWIDKDRYYRIGFDWKVDANVPENTGFYFPTSGGALEQLTNFVMRPLVHVYSKDDNNRRFTEIDNGFSTMVLELPSKVFTSPDQFENMLMDEGVYFCMNGFGKPQLNKLKTFFMKEYPKCYELKTLGWQPEGFFAYSNLIFKDGVVEFDKYGVAEVDDKKYLSMGASKALAEVRAEDDDYRNDKYLRYVATDLSFQGWTGLMHDVYGENGMMGICWALLAAFKDVIFRRNNNCPVPYAYGAVQAGKSKFAESVANIFTHEMPAFNLNQGTDYAFFERMERFRNVPVIFNEFDENAIKEEWFRAIKGAFDGEGRAKGSGRKNKTKTQDINCLPVLLGQFLSTKDDGSVLQRSIPVKFLENNQRSEHQVKQYNKLKTYEKQGITGICTEILTHRRYVTDNYLARFDEVGSRIKAALEAENVIGKNRIIENYTNALTIVSLIGDRIKLAFFFDAFFEYCKKQIMQLSTVISESNSLSEFWKTLEFLLDQNMLEQGFDFKIEVHTEVKISTDRTETISKPFAEPKKLLFLRFSSVYGLYASEKRKQTGKNGLNEQTILTYMRDQDYFIGANPKSQFKGKGGKGTITSSYVLDYDKLGVNLERFDDTQDDRELITLKGWIYADAKAVELMGELKTVFTLLQDESYQKGPLTIDKKIYTKCFYQNLDQVQQLKVGTEVRLTGLLSIQTKGDRQYRNMQVNKLDIMAGQTEMPISEVTPAKEDLF